MAGPPKATFVDPAGQTTVIDDKLYIDGGWVNFDDFQDDHVNYSNTWLGYHDLNSLIKRGGDYWPDLNITLNKNDSIPTVSGGVLWGDAVNKRFYLYGGEWTVGFAQEPYHLLSYDILYDKWDDFGPPRIAPPPEIASYGAGVGVSETGMGYYYGGWISNASMSGWTQQRTMSSRFYTYAYDTDTFAQAAGPDKNPRAEGAMVWIPAGDTYGLLVYMGGIVSPYGNGTAAPQPLDKVFVFDAAGNSWSIQTATGEIPQNRRQFCIDVAWAPDRSSFNIYLWGGLSVPPPAVNATSFNDIYILTLPSFIWVKAYPDHHGNVTLPDGHYSSSCNMVKSMSQLFVIGGTYTDTDKCDLGVTAWAQHSFWTGTNQNAGDDQTYWAVPDPNVTSNVVPIDVYNVVGGNKYGGATRVGPKAGFDSGNKPLQDLLERRPSIPPRSPTRHVPGPTNSSTPPPGPALSTGAIVGIAIGGAAGLVLVLFLWFLIGKMVAHRQEERRQSGMTQFSCSGGGSKAGAPSMASPQMSTGTWVTGSAPGLSSPEPCTQQDGSFRVVSELPTQQDVNELHQ
ncbi:kelch motif domain-containing protein [Hirsutella rhossiliensis]|uniref:Kelch motif domain-containing protein n=1 Tax=Hirsutella rhossiliensis TaxID=111463 RepID=A0A9P8MN39_9HYPO|nr:kelch motif domain-containing protein [Hirsutella rhossiliensis]KAH0958180.1 kelch motif domain-containing protein [Hirsutella rhossiliensis]